MQQITLEGNKTTPAEVIRTLNQSKPDIRDPITRVLYSITGPIIVTPSAASAEGAIPKKLLVYIKLQRLLQNMRILKGTEQPDMATDAEAIAYLMTASFDAPFSTEWTKIYMHLFIDYCKWMHITPPDFTKDASTLSDYEQTLLQRLKGWIYTKSIKAFKEKLKQQKKQEQNNNNIKQRKLLE